MNPIALNIYKQRRNAGKRAGQWPEAAADDAPGPVGGLTKERLYEASFAVECKLAALSA